MKKGLVAAFALVVGLFAGVAVGFLTAEKVPVGPSDDSEGCPKVGTVTSFTANLSVDEGLGQQAVVSASASAELEQADGSWGRIGCRCASSPTASQDVVLDSSSR